MAQRLCANCGKPLPKSMSVRAKYCCDSCRVKACQHRRKNGEPAAPKPKPRKKAPVIDKREFERMMDGSMEDVLRHNRDVLRKALDDPDTRPQDLPAISRQLIAIARELDSMSGGDPLLDDLDDETTEVSEDAGASIV
ncbi:hypothetical protein [Bifidobacterium callitrichos]|uniref:Uncharacterized protein n=1 Tax=Bifidobacterium callitrichos DSM 23973 TaxID=1437609 RepID=A0A087ACS4_9BIFI|nr:hypothetical protein [Bifidobacterium callitrichos]KFI56574.1 hypothetical protein BCAL_0169 [Bifidobacterium callitrichos DSM 23973]